jgi:hypothetical protein
VRKFGKYGVKNEKRFNFNYMTIMTKAKNTLLMFEVLNFELIPPYRDTYYDVLM